MLSVISRHKFRVPTRCSLVKNGFFLLKWPQKWPVWSKMAISKFHQSMPCGYSIRLPWNVWRYATEISWIQPSTIEKTFEYMKSLIFWPYFQRFLKIGWSKWPDYVCMVSVISWHKFRIPTKGTLAWLEIYQKWPYGAIFWAIFIMKIKYYPKFAI